MSLLFQAVIFGATYFSFTLWVQPWMAEFDATRSEVLLLVVIMQLMSGIAGPLIGPAMDRYSVRHLVIVGALLSSAALYLTAHASALWQVGLLYGGVLSIGTVLSGPLAAQTLAARWFDERRGTAIGLSSVGTSIGGVVIPLLVGIWLADGNWRAAHMNLAIVVLVGVVPAVWWFVRNSPEAAGVAPEASAATSEIAADYPDWTTLSLLKHPAFIGITLAVTPMIATTGAIQQNLAPFNTDLGIETTQTGLMVSVMAFVMVVGKIFFGMMADRWQHSTLFAIAVVIVFAALGLLLWQPTLPTMMVMAMLLGFGAGGFLPLLGAMVARQFGPASFGRAMGLLGPFITLSAAGPLLAGYLRDTTGSYDASWWTFMAILSVSALGLALLRRAG